MTHGILSWVKQLTSGAAPLIAQQIRKQALGKRNGDLTKLLHQCSSI